jgi:hypothetical protein
MFRRDSAAELEIEDPAGCRCVLASGTVETLEDVRDGLPWFQAG